MTNPKQAPEAQRPIGDSLYCALGEIKRLCAQLAERDARIAELETQLVEMDAVFMQSCRNDGYRSDYPITYKMVLARQQARKEGRDD